MEKINNDWKNILEDEFKKEYFITLEKFIDEEYKTRVIYPNQKDVFNAFLFTPYENVKCVIIGQDPYHNFGQAHGLCFSVNDYVDIPPSLQNIYKELNEDCGFEIPNNGCLEKWAKQGVLLLNTILTVREHSPLSHANLGWERFTDTVISKLNESDKPIVFILWGKPAQLKKKLLNNSKHLILCAPHPSPLSAYRGFFGSKPFSKTNEFLIKNGVEPIDWKIENV